MTNSQNTISQIATSNFRSIISRLLLVALPLFFAFFLASCDKSSTEPTDTNQETNYIILKGGPFSSSTKITMNDLNKADYNDDENYYYGFMQKNNFKMPNGSKRDLAFLHWFGKSPKTGYLNYNPNNDIYSAFAIALNGDIETIYAGFTGTVNIDKYDLDGNVEGSFCCTFEEVDSYEIIEGEGRFSFPFETYQKLQGDGNNSQRLITEIIKKIK